jgi:hypothetical protein
LAIYGDHGSRPGAISYVRPCVLGESLRSEAERARAQQVLGGLLILADRLQNFSVGYQRLVRLKGDWPGKGLRIFQRHLEIDVSEVEAVKTLSRAESFRMRVSGKIKPGSVIKSGRGDHERVSLPVPNRITEPGGIHLLGKPAAIGEDGSSGAAVGDTLIDNKRQRRGLDDPRHARKMVERRRVRQAVRARTVRSHIEQVLLVHLLCPGEFIGRLA